MDTIINKKIICILASVMVATIFFAFSKIHPQTKDNDEKRLMVGVTKADFSGRWAIDTIKTDLESQSNAAYFITIKQHPDSIKFEKLFRYFPLRSEILPLNGNAVNVKLNDSRFATRVVKWSISSDTMLIESTYTTQIPFQRLYESYHLVENAEILVVKRIYDDKAKIVNAFYTRKH